MALTCGNKYTLNSKYRHSPNEREKAVTLYHRGHRVCQKTFLFLHGISEFRLKAIKSSFVAQVVQQIHGHTGRVVPNAMVRQDVEEVVEFILQYAEQMASPFLAVSLDTREKTYRFYHQAQPNE